MARQPEDKYVLRFPDGMRDKLKELAAANKRSMNAEIVARLETSLVNEMAWDMAHDGAPDLADLAKVISQLQISMQMQTRTLMELNKALATALSKNDPERPNDPTS